MLAAMITRCQHLRTSLERLQEQDHTAFEAFLRALEKS
jgi:hypothetical protein